MDSRRAFRIACRRPRVLPKLNTFHQSESINCGGTAPAALNAANEVAVDAFLTGRLRFTDITVLIDAVMQAYRGGPADSLDAVLAADAWARTRAQVLSIELRDVAASTKRVS